MKRYLLLILLAAAVVGAKAETMLPRHLGGNILGKTTRSMVVQRMTSQGAKLSDYDEAKLVYDGAFDLNGYTMNRLAMGFANDTLTRVTYVDTLINEHHEKWQAFKDRQCSMYAGAKKAEDDFLANLLSDTLAAQEGIEKEAIWGRVDGKTIMFLYDANGEGIITILDLERLWNMFFATLTEEQIEELAKELAKMEGDADYDEANKVTAVAGCKFGAAKTDVRTQLIKKFGNPTSEDEHEMFYKKVTIGGQLYDMAIFYFMYNPATKRQEFVAASLQQSYYEWEDEKAREQFSITSSQYGRKYTNENKKTDKYNEKNYLYGMLEDDYYPICVSMEKSLTKGGDMRWFVVVNYFTHKLVSLYDDEI